MTGTCIDVRILSPLPAEMAPEVQPDKDATAQSIVLSGIGFDRRQLGADQQFVEAVVTVDDHAGPAYLHQHL